MVWQLKRILCILNRNIKNITRLVQCPSWDITSKTVLFIPSHTVCFVYLIFQLIYVVQITFLDDVFVYLSVVYKMLSGITHSWNAFLWIIFVIPLIVFRCQHITDSIMSIADLGKWKKPLYFFSPSKYPINLTIFYILNK